MKKRLKFILIIIFLVLIIFNFSFSSQEEEEIDLSNSDTYLNPDINLNDFIGDPNFDWSKVPDNRIREINPENLDYSQLNPSQRQSMIAPQIQANLYNIGNLFTEVNTQALEDALRREFGFSFSVQGPASFLSDGTLVGTNGHFSNLNSQREEIDSVTINSDGTIEIIPKREIERFGVGADAITIEIADEFQSEIRATDGDYRVNIDEETGGTRTVVDAQGREFQVSSGLVTVQDGSIFLSSQTGSVRVNGVQLELQSGDSIGTEELVGLISSSSQQGGVIDIDSSRLSSDSQAILQGVFNPLSLEEERRVASVPAREVISVVPDQILNGEVVEQGNFRLQDGITAIRAGSTTGTAESGYTIIPINNQIGLNLGVEEVRTVDYQGTDSDAQIYSRTDDEGTTRVRTNVNNVEVDRGSDYKYTLSPTFLGVNNQNNHGGVFFQPWMQQGTIGVESRGGVSTMWGGVAANIGNLGDNDGLITSTQSCQGNINCVARRDLGNNQEVISLTGDSSSNWGVITRGNDNVQRNYFAQVDEGGRIEIDEGTNNDDNRRIVSMTSDEMIMSGFSNIPSNIFGVMTNLRDGNIYSNYILSGQREIGTMEGSSGVEIRTIIGLEDSSFQEQISAFILAQEKYDSQVFEQNSIYDAFMQLNMPQIANSLEARRDLYRLLFDEEPPSNSAVMNEQLLERLRLGSEVAFEGLVQTSIRTEQIGTINEQLFGTEIALALQELRISESGGVDPTSLVPEVFSDSFETIISQDTSQTFNSLSQNQRLSIVDTLRAVGVDNPSFEMRRELYRVLEGELPPTNDRGETMNLRLLEAIENNEFQNAVSRYNAQLQQRADTLFGGDLGAAIDDLNQRERQIQEELGTIIDNSIDCQSNSAMCESVERIVISQIRAGGINSIDGSESIGDYLGVGDGQIPTTSTDEYFQSIGIRMGELYDSIRNSIRSVSQEEAEEIAREALVLEQVNQFTYSQRLLTQDISTEELRSELEVYLNQISLENLAPDSSLIPPQRPLRERPQVQGQSDFPPTPDNVAQLATQGSIRLDEFNLIGIFGTPSSRSVMIRSPNGEMLRGGVGDRIEGVGVIQSVVGDSSINILNLQGEVVTMSIGG
ncbi:MAG: hypothetical protein LAT82_03230 [Nanoarchaeota archaeon]|nr:hypothetical protein [Nanoarchaeota archaeon]